MSELITCKDLTKRFGNHTALDHLNLSLDSGKIIGLLGPNGSGKTTLLKLLNGLLTPSEGEVLIACNRLVEAVELCAAAHRENELDFLFRSLRHRFQTVLRADF